MKQSSSDEIIDLYESTADSYAEMMDAEIDLPLYADTLSGLHARLGNLAGPLIDTSCGSGHMLQLYSECYDPVRELIGIDLTPQMVGIAKKRLGSMASVNVGDMRSLSMIADESAAAVLSFFALHHVDMPGVRDALCEWHRVLRPGGQLVIASWEGVGLIDYGEHSDVIAFKHEQQLMKSSLKEIGFFVERCVVENVEGLEMDAVYLEAARAQAGKQRTLGLNRPGE